MMKRIPHAPIYACTDLPCPISGIWENVGSFKTCVTIKKGSKMPYYCGMKVNWRLIIDC